MSEGYEQQPKPSLREIAANTMLVRHTIVTVHKLCLAVFMRRGFGTKAFDPYGFFALVVLIGLSAAYPVLYTFMVVWFFTLVAQRIDTFRLYLKGYRGHSRYHGFPWLAGLMPNVKTPEQALRFEPFMCLFVGLFIATFSAPLGVFVMAGFVSFPVSMAIEEISLRREVQEMNDSEIEMENISERFRRQ